MIVRPGRSIRARLALLASVAMTLLCVAAAALLLWATRTTIVDIRTREVVSTALRVVYLIKDHDLPRVTSIDLDGLQVVDASGQVVSSTSNLAGSPRLIRTVPEDDKATRIGTMCDRPEFAGDCQIVVSFRAYEPDGDWIVYAFGPLPPWYVSPAAITFLTLFTVVLVALTWFGVSRVVAGTLAPVQAPSGWRRSPAATGRCACPCPTGPTRSEGWPRPRTRRSNAWSPRLSSSAASPPTPPTTCAARSRPCGPSWRWRCSRPRRPTGARPARSCWPASTGCRTSSPTC
ncbi:hypothetical protein [Nonomuraea salmonea]|uniref:hypothetical protein n=1 Tax=Nonomuraea salmonea TaxID=46181 RepID=UPI0031E5E85F